MADAPMDVAKRGRSNKVVLGAWIVSGWLLFFVVVAGTWWLMPVDMTARVDTPSARLSFVLSHLFCASTLLFLGFLAVGATRWQLETRDPMGASALRDESGGDEGQRDGKQVSTHRGDGDSFATHSRVHVQFLSNTTEQFVMFSAAALAATPFLTTPFLRVITLATVAWIAGRLLFWGGYWYTATRGLPAYPRAVGLGLGLLCTLALAAIAATGICLHFPSFAYLFGSRVVARSALGGGGMIIDPPTSISGENLLPVAFFSALVVCVALLARFPRLAPPVIPIAVLSSLGWAWLLLSGVIPIR
ncbi:MAG: MAPEG family protein [Nannocystaceae bacterium]